MKAVVSEKGQVTIPKTLRDSLGIKPGQVLEFEEQRGTLVAWKCMPEDDGLEAVFGILAGQGTTDVWIEEQRGPGPE
jgi:AbrB family looped-hinge helix DNA binding protein